MKLILSVLILVALGVSTSWARSNDVCYNYVVCPNHCPDFGQLPMVAIIIPLFTFGDFRGNMDSAIDYIEQYNGVITTDKGLLLHTSLNCKYCVIISNNWSTPVINFSQRVSNFFVPHP
jgi:hypothetical protein